MNVFFTIVMLLSMAFGKGGADLPISTLTLENGMVVPFNAMVQERGPDQLTVFTHQSGERTPPFSEDTIEYVVVGDLVVGKNTNGTNGTYIPTNGYVLSASGIAAQYVGNLEIGTTLTAKNFEIPVLPQKYFSVNGTTLAYDRINGMRGEGEIVLYQPSFGQSTGANGWGLEITVSSDKVTGVVGIRHDAAVNDYLSNDSPIPRDGYVISIHAANPLYNELVDAVKVGDPAALVVDNFQFQAGKTRYDAFNPSESFNFHPGARGIDQLIIYDSSYGTYTGTNPYGYEAIVDKDGFIVANGGNDNRIPEGGYVLSGHGVNNTWLTKHALIGSKVIIDQDNQQLLIMFTPESILKNVEYGIINAENKLQTAKSQFLDIPYELINEEIDSAKMVYNQAKTAAIDNGDLTDLSGLLATLNQHLSDMQYMFYESRRVDTRGLWVRPKETTIEQVRENVKKMKETNINSIYLETWFEGYTIYPTDNKMAKQNPMYNGFDVLKAYIEEAAKLDIEVHAWVENFFIGSINAGYPKEWLMISRRGEEYGIDRDGVKWYYLNPALPVVRDFISSIHKELLAKYEVASLHLDYARYGESGDYTNDYGYDEYTRSLFKKQTGSDPLDLKPGDHHWVEWLEFRTNIINTWVDRVVKETKKQRPEILITAAVWPNYEEAPHSHAQETKDWVDKNYIDHLFHMSYVQSTPLLEYDLELSLKVADGKTFVSSGVGTFINLSKEELVRQINAVTAAGSDGTAIFEFETLFSESYDHVLKLGVYRNEAVMPDYRKTEPMAVLVDEMIRKIDEIYIPFQGMAEQDVNTIKEQLQSAGKTLDNSSVMRQSIANSVKQKLESVHKETSESNTIHEEVKKRLLADLSFGIRMLNLYLMKSSK